MENPNLLIAALGFTLIHFVSITGLRAKVVGKYGLGAWLGPFAVLTLGFVSWMIYEFIYAEVTEELWYMPDWWLWVNAVLMLIILGFMIFSEWKVKVDRLGGGLLAVTRHPSNWGTAIFAALHMLTNSSVESLIFFGSFLLVGIFGSLFLDWRKTREGDEKWLELVAVTSWMPFLAIIQGRNKFRFKDFKWWQGVVLLVVWAAVIELHRGYFGKYILPL